MRYLIVALLGVLLLGSLACTSAGSIRQRTERAAEMMVSDGVDPATATPEQWDTYIDKAIAERRMSLVERVIGVAWPDLLRLWGLASAALGLGTARGRANLAVIADPDTEWSETGRSLAALTLGLRSPDVAHERAKKVAA